MRIIYIMEYFMGVFVCGHLPIMNRAILSNITICG